MSAASDDRELEQALTDAAQLRQRYRAASQDEPPAALDSLISSAARDHAGRDAGRGASRFASAWRVPLSIAAVVVVSATVSILVGERHGQLPSGTDRSVSASGASEDGKRIGAGALQEQMPAAPAAQSQSRERVGAEGPQGAAPKAPVVIHQAGSEVRSAPPELVPSRESFKIQQPASQSPSPDVTSSVAPPQAPPPPVMASPSTVLGRPGSLRDEPQAPERAQESHDRVAPERPPEALRKDRSAQGVAPAAAAAKIERDRGQAESKLASAKPVWENDPQAWLKHIDELRLAGQRADANASYRAFRERYPDYPLPPGFVVPER